MRIARGAAIALVLLLATLAAPSPARAQAADSSSQQIDILFIGNSYTYYNDLPSMLRTLVGAGRDSIIVHVASVTEGGASLRTHWNDRTIARIRERAWDYVVLQEQSLTPIERRPQFVDYGRRFAAEIRSAGAQVVLCPRSSMRMAVIPRPLARSSRRLSSTVCSSALCHP